MVAKPMLGFHEDILVLGHRRGASVMGSTGDISTRYGASDPAAWAEPSSLPARRRARTRPPPAGEAGHFARTDPSPQHRMALLARTIEQEIVPRLVLARRAVESPAPPPPAEEPPVRPEAVTALTDLVLANDFAAAMRHVQALRRSGVSVERLYLDLLAPTARRLGEMWSEDRCDFTAVTLGLWRLEQVLREVSPEFCDDPICRDPGRRALLAAVPGEQHGFGIIMVAEFFRRAGWDVRSGPVASLGELATLVRSEWFAIIGFSISCESRLEAAAAAIRTVRRASRNPCIGVMVGGRVFLEHPELVALVGADATAADGRHAALQAETLRSMLAGRA